MKSELVKIGPIIIHGYGLMIAIGIIVGRLLLWNGNNKYFGNCFFIALLSRLMGLDWFQYN